MASVSKSEAARTAVPPLSKSLGKGPSPSTTVAAPRDVQTNVAATTFSGIFWDLMFGVLGYHKEHIDTLRSTDESLRPSPDVCELVTTDLSWTDPAIVHKVRDELQEYIAALRVLKLENQRDVRVRAFVDQKRYEALRSREASLKVSSDTITQRFSRLDLSTRRMARLDEGLMSFTSITELVLSRNALEEINVIPPSLQFLIASGNRIRDVSFAALESAINLYVIGLSCNNISDITFLLSARSAICVDLSFNAISSVEHVIEIVSGHTSLKELNLTGCPVTFAPGYRSRILSACKNLRALDEVSTGVGGDASVKVVLTPDAAAPTPNGVASPAMLSPHIKSPGRTAATAVSSLPLSNSNASPQLPPPSSLPDDFSPHLPTVYISFVSIRGVQTLMSLDDSQRLLSAGGKKPPPKEAPKKLPPGAKVEEEKGPSLQSVCSLSGSWCVDSLAVALRDVDLAPPPPVAEDPKAAKGAAAKKPPVASEVVTVPDELPLKHIIAGQIPLETVAGSTLADAARKLWPVDFRFEEQIVNPSTTPPTKTTNFSIQLGTFVVDVFDSLVQLQASGQPKMELVVPLRVQRDAIAAAEDSLRRRGHHLQQMTAEDVKLDHVLAEMIAAETAAAEQQAGASAALLPPPKGGKAPPPKASTVQRTLSEGLVTRQHESAQRKVLIEEFTALTKEEEKKLQRLKNANISLVLQVSLNAPIERDKTPDAAPAAVVPKKK